MCHIIINVRLECPLCTTIYDLLTVGRTSIPRPYTKMCKRIQKCRLRILKSLGYVRPNCMLTCPLIVRLLSVNLSSDTKRTFISKSSFKDVYNKNKKCQKKRRMCTSKAKNARTKLWRCMENVCLYK